MMVLLLVSACSSEDEGEVEAPSPALTNTASPTRDINATVTAIVATEMQSTQVFIEEREARRTEIALTREPTAALAMLTPIPLELTLTSVVEGIYATQTAIGPAGQQQTAEAGLLAMTATADYRAANPDWTLTPQPTWPPFEGCQPVLAMGNLIEAEEIIVAALNEAEIILDGEPIIYAGVMTISDVVADPQVEVVALLEMVQSVVTGYGETCPPEQIYSVLARIEINGLEPMPDEATRADLVAQHIAVLVPLEGQIEVGARPARLQVRFRATTAPREFWVESSYANAVRTYEEGLRGAELIEALGGWVN